MMQPMATDVKRPSGRAAIQDAVLDAAARLWATSGPGDVSLRAIAAEAGVNYGLVHRHFGTKDVLIERLMERYAERWETTLGSGADYDTALDRLFGTGPETGAYLRLLAWTLLGESDSASAQAPERTALLDRLPTLRRDVDDPDVAAHDTAAALAFIFGWRFFNPFIRAVLHLDDEQHTHEAMRAYLPRLAGGPGDPSGPGR